MTATLGRLIKLCTLVMAGAVCVPVVFAGQNMASTHGGRILLLWSAGTPGVAAFVQKYRLRPKYHHPIELGDA